MDKEEFLELIKTNNISEVHLGYYSRKPNAKGLFKIFDGYCVYCNDSSGNLYYRKYAKTIDEAYIDLLKKMELYKTVDFNSEKIKKTLSINKFDLMADKDIVNFESKKLHRYITLYRVYQVMLLNGISVKELLDREDRLLEKATSYAMINEINMHKDAIITAHYKNVTKGIMIDKKVYKMPITDDFSFSLNEIYSRKLK